MLLSLKGRAIKLFIDLKLSFISNANLYANPCAKVQSQEFINKADKNPIDYLIEISAFNRFSPLTKPTILLPVMTGKNLSEQVLNFFAISMILVSASTESVSSAIKSATLPASPLVI